jgi:CDP-diacylglycerol--serine O-phosphatidyltransferase
MLEQPLVRFAVPQLLTGTRLVLGTVALISAMDGRTYMAATMITSGAVTDGLDGFVARRLDATSPFGALFDYFADYVCYVVAPWAVARALLDPGAHWLIESAVALPLLTAAIRYARNALTVATQRESEVPGLGTVFFAFLIVTAVFLEAPRLIGQSRFSIVLPVSILAVSILMVSPLRYPKIARFPGVWPIVLVLVAIMPFAGTKFLAAAMLGIGVLYPLVAPRLVKKSKNGV